MVVAPATADLLARFAHGNADDFLTTLYLAFTGPVVLAPAMNTNMWQHAATQANLEVLRRRGHRVVEPEDGFLACGMTGPGRLADPERIARAVVAEWCRRSDLEGETILVTAGPTQEALDPVRYISNRSSGKMGYAVAEAARRRGARVILVSAPVSLPSPLGCEVVPVVSADQMRRAVMGRLPEASVVVMAAAVSDYRVKEVAAQKIKRSGTKLLELEATEDILAEVVARRREGTRVIGFAAETENVLANGRAKLERKGVDAVVVNDVSSSETGFDSEKNAGSFLTRDGAVEFPAMNKLEMAGRILDEIRRMRVAVRK
jgi:phosphopantothenoylcysteine decarboxylase/phosphopantothenate--cysteine ligase